MITTFTAEQFKEDYLNDVTLPYTLLRSKTTDIPTENFPIHYKLDEKYKQTYSQLMGIERHNPSSTLIFKIEIINPTLLFDIFNKDQPLLSLSKQELFDKETSTIVNSKESFVVSEIIELRRVGDNPHATLYAFLIKPTCMQCLNDDLSISRYAQYKSNHYWVEQRLV